MVPRYQEHSKRKGQSHLFCFEKDHIGVEDMTKGCIACCKTLGPKFRFLAPREESTLETTPVTPVLGKPGTWIPEGLPASRLAKMVSSRFYEKACFQSLAREP